MNTIEQVHSYVIENTKAYCLNNDYVLTTEELASKVNVSRTVVSRYLNQLLKEKKLLKVSTRPVIYFDKKTIENEFSISLEKIDEFLSIGEMNKYLLNQKKTSIDNVIIGTNGSLSDAFLKVKSFFSILKHENSVISIIGEKGTGKKHIIRNYFEYIKETDLYFNEYQLVIINCKSSDKVEDTLFGKEDKKIGLLNDNNKYIVYLSHADELSESLQQKIAFMVDKLYEKEESKIGIVFSRENERKKYVSTLSDLIQMNIELPSLENRPLQEIEKLTLYFFKNEENKIQKKIYIGRNTFEAISCCEYKKNIDGLVNTIQTTIYNATCVQNKISNVIQIRLYNLPEDVLLSKDSLVQMDDTNLLSLVDIQNNLLMNNVIKYYDDILEIFKNSKEDSSDFFKHIKDVLNQYCDFIVFTKQDSNKRIDTYTKIIENIFETVGKRNKIIIYSNYSYVIASIIYKLTYLDDEIQIWEEINQETTRKILEMFCKKMNKEYRIAMEIIDRIKMALDIRLDTINSILLMMNMHYYGENPNVYKVAGLVIAHGYSTASSICDSVNRLMGEKIVYPIDMALDVKVEEIIKKIKLFISYYRVYEELILMVDMGSLEHMVNDLLENNNNRIGILNNISTKVVLSVANGIRNKLNIDTILKNTCDQAKFDYKIYENTKIPAVLFTNETGDAATTRVIEVFRNSLPKDIDLAFVMLDILSLKDKEKLKQIFDRYNVLMITGTVDIATEDIPFIAIDDLVACSDINKINLIFKPYLSEVEIQKFSSNLIKNFSLGNIMQSLTILNATVLIDYLEEAIESLERSLYREFNNKVKIRLYIHLSSLIERLVTKQKLLDYPKLIDFEAKHKNFIDVFRKSFARVSKYYGIEIPTSEIAYLYEYIFTNEGEKYE